MFGRTLTHRCHAMQAQTTGLFGIDECLNTLFATKWAKSLRGNTCAQIFVSDKDFCAIYPMKKESEYILALKEFAKDVGAPEVLICDLAKTERRCLISSYSKEIVPAAWINSPHCHLWSRG